MLEECYPNNIISFVQDIIFRQRVSAAELGLCFSKVSLFSLLASVSSTWRNCSSEGAHPLKFYSFCSKCPIAKFPESFPFQDKSRSRAKLSCHFSCGHAHGRTQEFVHCAVLDGHFADELLWRRLFVWRFFSGALSPAGASSTGAASSGRAFPRAHLTPSLPGAPPPCFHGR